MMNVQPSSDAIVLMDRSLTTKKLTNYLADSYAKAAVKYKSPT